MKYQDNRYQIISRKSDSDENGLFFSLPVTEIYQTLNNEEQNQTELIIEGYANLGFSEKVFFPLVYLFDNFCFLQNSKTAKTVLSVQECLISTNGDKVKFGLYAMFNPKTTTIDFYDVYFCKDIEWTDELVKHPEIPLRPFFIGNIYGNVCSKMQYSSITNDFMLDIHPYSGVVKGVVNSNDCLFTYLNQPIFHYSEEMQSHISSIEQLIGNYVCKNGILQKITNIKTEPRWQEILNIKNNYVKLRQLDYEIHNITIYKRIFESFENISIVQQDIKNKTIQRQMLFNEVSQKIESINAIKYQEFLNKNKKYIEEHKFKYYSSLCLLIKNENEYLPEWLDHHNKIGIEHFYIYDNGSTIPILETIKEYKNGYYLDKTTVIEWVGKFKHMQHDCYEHCLLNFGEETFWIGFIDTDELLETDENIKVLLSEYEKDFSLWIPWEVYNSNGHIQKPKMLQKEAYTNAIPNPFGLRGKVFIQPHRTKKMYVHLGYPLSEFDQTVNNDHSNHHQNIYNLNIQYYSQTERKMFERIKCNHYVTRSFEEWKDKIMRGSCDPTFLRKFIAYFKYNPDLTYLLNDPEIQELIDTKQPYIA